MMRHIDGSLDADHLDHKNDLKKDIFRRKAQLNQVKKTIISCYLGVLKDGCTF